MPFPFFAAIATAVKFVFTSQSLIASAIRFVAGSVVSQLLSGQTKVEGPRLSDLRVQVSTYGNPIPRVYGQEVRIAGNVIDKSDLIEHKKTKKKKMLGITIASQTTYTYSVDLAILIADGELPENAMRRLLANGSTIFDRDASGATTGTPIAGGGTEYTRLNNTSAVFEKLRYYPGNATQPVDAVLQDLHPSEDVPAYRHSAYVVIEGLLLTDYGNGVPNIEFIVETNFPYLRAAVEDLASYADVVVNARQIDQVLKGYVVARAGSVWSALEPLAGTFAFDLITFGDDFRAIPRGVAMITILEEEDFAARPSDARPRDLYELTREDPNTYPDEVTVTYVDADRDYQPNTQRAFRNEGYSKNKVDVEVAITLDATEARQVAGRTLAESLASTGAVKLYVSERFRWLHAGDVIGVPVGPQTEPFRINEVNQSPNGVVILSGIFEDILSYSGDIPGASGSVPDNDVALPGDTILQLIDASIVEDVDDDTGFYFAVTGAGSGWRGVDIYRAEGVGSPLVFELITDPIVSAVIGECTTTLGAGPTDVVDYVNTLDVQLYDGELETVTEEDMLVRNANFAWVGGADGGEGEYINFTTAVPSGSPNIWTLGSLLRGRRGTEFAVAAHAASERFVMVSTDVVQRMDFGPIDWNLTRTFKPVSFLQDDSQASTQEFTNTGEGKRPYAPVHLTGTRNGSNDDVLLGWTRRTRYETPAIGGGPVPLGEEVESYEVDIYSGSPLAVIRTLTSATPSVNYTEAMQTADGHPLGDPVTVDVYQMSGIRGRGHVASGVV